MTEQWDGRPQNPERDGRHWLQFNDDLPLPTAWIAEIAAWASGGAYSPEGVVELGFRYLGPCLTPAEVETRVAAARIEGATVGADDLEAARREGIKEAVKMCAEFRSAVQDEFDHASTVQMEAALAAAISALDEAEALIRTLLEGRR